MHLPMFRTNTLIHLLQTIYKMYFVLTSYTSFIPVSLESADSNLQKCYDIHEEDSLENLSSCSFLS